MKNSLKYALTETVFFESGQKRFEDGVSSDKTFKKEYHSRAKLLK